MRHAGWVPRGAMVSLSSFTLCTEYQQQGDNPEESRNQRISMVDFSAFVCGFASLALSANICTNMSDTTPFRGVGRDLWIVELSFLMSAIRLKEIYFVKKIWFFKQGLQIID
jgi:hypothetical protein